MDELRLNGVAYLNVDVATVGPDFEASASPLLSSAILSVLDRVADPISNKTLRSAFAERGSSIGGLGAGSEYVAFQDLAGVSSADMSFSGDGFPYHSCYDNFDWMENFGDPGFTYHTLMAQVWMLLILDLADRELLPFDFNAYADAFAGYVNELEGFIATSGGKLDTAPLRDAASEFTDNAKQFHEWDQAWSNLVFGASGGFESHTMAIKRMSHNARMSNFEKNLLDIDGGVSRPHAPSPPFSSISQQTNPPTISLPNPLHSTPQPLQNIQNSRTFTAQ